MPLELLQLVPQVQPETFQRKLQIAPPNPLGTLGGESPRAVSAGLSLPGRVPVKKGLSVLSS